MVAADAAAGAGGGVVHVVGYVEEPGSANGGKFLCGDGKRTIAIRCLNSTTRTFEK